MTLEGIDGEGFFHGNIANSDISNSIGSLEHHLHKIFATVRVPGEDFVYSPSAELFNELDDYCNVQTMAESKPPLLILGESGENYRTLNSIFIRYINF